jgi:hypothetical protein
VALHFLLTSDLLESLKLDTAPVGWQEMKYLFQRDEVYHGVTLTMGSDLTFWKLGAAYLRLLYEGGTDADGKVIDAQGVEAVAVLNVFERDPNEFRTSEIYRARIDFTTYRSSENGVQVKLKELGFATNLLTRADSEIDLLPSTLGATSLGGAALAPLEPATILLHSQMLRLQYEATQEGESPLSDGLMFGDNEDASHEQLLYFGFNKAGTNDLGLEPVFGGFVAGEAKDAVAIYTAKENGVFSLDFAIYAYVEAHVSPGLFMRQFTKVDARYYLRVVRSGVTQDIELLPALAVRRLDGDYAGEIIIPPRKESFDLKKGDGIYLFATYFVHDLTKNSPDPYQATITAKMKPGSYLRIVAESTTDPTACRGMLVHEVLKRQVEAMTDNSGGFYSEYYGRTDTNPAYAVDGPGALTLITNGFGLRGFPLPIDAVIPNADGTDPRKPLTASFSTLYGSLDKRDCLGASIEQRNGQPTLRVEHRSFFYQPTESLRLGVIAKLVKSVYTPLLYNAVEVGYQHWQSGSAVGLDEFNGQRSYSLPLTQVKGTYSLVSQVNESGYLIEEARRQPYVLGKSKEGQADQELFAIRLRRGPTGSLETEKNEAFVSVSGILDKDTAYNLADSPGRMLKRHGFWLRAGLVPVAGKKLLRTATQGNDKLVSQLFTETVALDEHADVPIKDLAAPLFVAETYEFTAKLRRHQVRQLAKKPYGLISFLDGQRQRKQGYLLKMECSPESGEASFTLLRAAS